MGTSVHLLYRRVLVQSRGENDDDDDDDDDDYTIPTQSYSLWSKRQNDFSSLYWSFLQGKRFFINGLFFSLLHPLLRKTKMLLERLFHVLISFFCRVEHKNRRPIKILQLWVIASAPIFISLGWIFFIYLVEIWMHIKLFTISIKIINYYRNCILIIKKLDLSSLSTLLNTLEPNKGSFLRHAQPQTKKLCAYKTSTRGYNRCAHVPIVDI